MLVPGKMVQPALRAQQTRLVAPAAADRPAENRTAARPTERFTARHADYDPTGWQASRGGGGGGRSVPLGQHWSATQDPVAQDARLGGAPETPTPARVRGGNGGKHLRATGGDWDPVALEA